MSLLERAPHNWWLESPGFRDGQSVCINDAQAERDADGTIRIRVGPDDPGGGNWLDTKGRRETILLARNLLPGGELPPIVRRVIDVRPSKEGTPRHVRIGSRQSR